MAGVSFQRRPAMPFGGSCVTHQWQRGREPRLNAFAQIAWRGFPSVGALPNSTLLPANAEAIRDTPVNVAARTRQTGNDAGLDRVARYYDDWNISCCLLRRQRAGQ